jgi:hypothetical protein
VETAIIVARGSSTPVVRNPSITMGSEGPDVAPRRGGNIRLPAPKKRAKSIKPVVTIPVAGLVFEGRSILLLMVTVTLCHLA